MTTEPTPIEPSHPRPKVIRQGGASEAVYGLGRVVYGFRIPIDVRLHCTSFQEAVCFRRGKPYS
jgi:hypothetical protein